jgi:hypothetical protein
METMNTITVQVRAIRPPDNEPQPLAGPMGAMLVADATRLDTGEQVTFVGDKRMLWDMQHALDDGITVVAEVEGWQILARAN